MIIIYKIFNIINKDINNLNKKLIYKVYNVIKILIIIIINVKINKEYNMIQFIYNNKVVNNIRFR